ncbi:MAG: biopolymer transporter ExbD [Melioribacteraceae bacterium]
MKFERNKKPLSSFSLSSLTDIVFLLLIFFLLTSQFVVQTGVKVKLPSSKLNEQSIPTKMIVSLTEEGKVYIGSEETNLDELSIKIDGLKETLNESNLIIRADKTVNIDLVIQVIDAAKAVGVDKFTIETEKQGF